MSRTFSFIFHIARGYRAGSRGGSFPGDAAGTGSAQGWTGQCSCIVATGLIPKQKAGAAIQKGLAAPAFFGPFCNSRFLSGSPA